MLATSSSPEIFWPFSAVCLTVLLFEFWPRTLTFELYEKKPTTSEIIILECSYSPLNHVLCPRTRATAWIISATMSADLVFILSDLHCRVACDRSWFDILRRQAGQSLWNRSAVCHHLRAKESHEELAKVCCRSLKGEFHHMHVVSIIMCPARIVREKEKQHLLVSSSGGCAERYRSVRHTAWWP